MPHIRQGDIWVLEGYLDEAGWDGERQFFYFTRKQDAEYVGEQLHDAFLDYHNGIGFQYDVYKLGPIDSFYQRESERAAFVKGLIDEWREDE